MMAVKSLIFISLPLDHVICRSHIDLHIYSSFKIKQKPKTLSQRHGNTFVYIVYNFLTHPCYSIQLCNNKSGESGFSVLLLILLLSICLVRSRLKDSCECKCEFRQMSELSLNPCVYEITIFRCRVSLCVFVCIFTVEML